MVPGLQAVANAGGLGSNLPLVTAARERFERTYGCDLGSLTIQVDTNIPRSVGLAGSSAIILAVLEVCAAVAQVEVTPMERARLAHAVERRDLGIAGGWQDQVIQSHGVTALMEFDEPMRLTPVRPPAGSSIPLFIAYAEHAAQDSGVGHAALASTRRDEAVQRAMTDLAEHARAGAAAVASCDIHTLKAAMETTFSLRQKVMTIARPHLAMIDCAKQHGVAANFAGSGGAIVGVVPKRGEAFLQALQDEGYEVRSWNMT